MFKVGDKVVLTDYGRERDNLRKLIAIHKTLTVKAFYEEGRFDYVKLEEGGTGEAFYASRFMLAERPANLRKWAKEQHIYNYSRLNSDVLLAIFYGKEINGKVPVKKKAAPPKDLYQLVKAEGIEGLNNWAYEMPDGEINVTTGAPCYAHFYYARAMKRMVVDVALGLEELPEEDHEDYKEYLRYHLNESPFAKIYITKDVDKAITHGVYIDVTQNHSQVVAALIDLRCAYEFPQSLAVFSALRKEGLSNHVAKWLSMLFKEQVKDIYVWSPITSHVSITQSMSKEGLGQFFARGIHRKPTDCAFNQPHGSAYQVNNSVAPTGPAIQKPKGERRFEEWGYGYYGYDLAAIKEVANEMEALIVKGKE